MNEKKSIFLFLLLLMVVAVATFIYERSTQQDGTREIAAFVNSQPIYADEIAKELKTLDAAQVGVTNASVALNFLIEKKILLQEAEAQGITASPAEVEKLYNDFGSLEEISEALAKQGLTDEEFRKRLEEQVIINKLIDGYVSLRSVVTKVSNEEVQGLYDANFKGTNVTFEEVEEGLVLFLLDRKKEGLRSAYISSLRENSDIMIIDNS